MSISTLIDRIGAKLRGKPTCAEVRQKMAEALGGFHTACIENRAENNKLIQSLRENRHGSTEIQHVIAHCGHSCPAKDCLLHAFSEQQPRKFNEDCLLLDAYRTGAANG